MLLVEPFALEGEPTWAMITLLPRSGIEEVYISLDIHAIGTDVALEEGYAGFLVGAESDGEVGGRNLE